MSLIYKFIFVITTLAIILVVALSLLLYAFTKSSLEQSIATHQLELARQTMNNVDRFLYEKRNNILVVSENEELKKILLEKDIHDPQKIAKSDTKLRELSLVTGPWNTLDLVSSSGEVALSINKEKQGENITKGHLEKDAFTKILAGEVYSSDIFMNHKSNEPTMIFAAPIRNEEDANKKIIGAVIGQLAWPTVLKVLQDTKGSDITLFNKEGVEIGSNHPENNAKILQFNVHDNKGVQQALSGKSGSEILQGIDKKEDTLTSYVPQKGFSSYKGNQWALLIQNPTSIAFREVKKNVFVLSVLIIIIVLTTAICILLFIQKIVIKPIVELKETTEEIALGNLSKRVKSNSNDEIGQLGSSFNEMTRRLQELYQGLEEKVKEKTAQLAQKIQEVEKEKAKDDAILASIGEGLMVYDEKGTFVFANKIAKDLIPLDNIDPISKNPLEKNGLFYSDGKTPIPEEALPVARTIKRGEYIDGEIMFMRNSKLPNGIYISSTARPMRDSNGTILGAVMIFRNVTKEKEIDRMKTEFISLASHQLRTPLSAIKWFSEMLVAGDAGELTNEQKDFAKNISDSTERMIELVNSLLNISRIESGRIVVDPKPTNLKELVDGIVKELQVKLSQQQQTIIVSVHNDLPKINLDPKLIRQVYLNLLTNAIKYTQKGGEISVFISKKDNEIVSQVTDNGYGIPKSQQTKVFQKFFRAENIIKVETDGTGLGLYLIKAIIESSKGKIWFESYTKEEATTHNKQGTSFWFSLPITGMEAKEGEVTLDA